MSKKSHSGKRLAALMSECLNWLKEFLKKKIKYRNACHPEARKIPSSSGENIHFRFEFFPHPVFF